MYLLILEQLRFDQLVDDLDELLWSGHHETYLLKSMVLILWRSGQQF